MPAPDLDALRQELRVFVDERDWDKFHSPKDLAASISIEAGELLEVFQWRDPHATDLSEADRARIGEELADVMMYCMLLADKTGISLAHAVRAKLEQNRAKYPVEKARSRADKYDKL